jgi:pilus assembly protein Flp/PilA
MADTVGILSADECRGNGPMLKVAQRFLHLLRQEDGQDMVEYALIVALMAFGVAAGMQSVASGISGEFTRVSATLVSYIS